MRKTTLLRIAILPMGVMNLLPWTDSTVRTAAVLGIEASALYVWSFSFLCLVFAIFIGLVPL